MDVFRNDLSASYLHTCILFNVRFRSCMMPSDWGKGIIHPIPKSSTADRRDQLSYRGITLANLMYKIYCHMLIERLTKWVEANYVVLDYQNDFRSRRSTIDQIMSLVNIIDTRKKNKLPTVCAFIDFKKVYDNINRGILWERLRMAGVGGRMMSALQSYFVIVMSDESRQNSGRGLVDHKLVQAPQ